MSPSHLYLVKVKEYAKYALEVSYCLCSIACFLQKYVFELILLLLLYFGIAKFIKKEANNPRVVDVVSKDE